MKKEHGKGNKSATQNSITNTIICCEFNKVRVSIVLDTITVSPTTPPFQHPAIKVHGDDISNAINTNHFNYITI